jgi:hypothetical protein
MAEIQLSTELFKDIEQAVLKQQADADQGVVLQYLAAVMGYMLASQRSMQPDDRAAFLDELIAFVRHVHDDVAASQQQAAPAGAGQAFGYWEPPAN